MFPSLICLIQLTIWVGHCYNLSHAPNFHNLDSLQSLNFLETPSLNQISELPIGLEYLQLFKTGIETVPELYDIINLSTLWIINNVNVSIIPDLPINLVQCGITENENLICIGTYPDTLESSLGQLPKCSDGIIYQIEESLSEWYISINLIEVGICLVMVALAL